VVEQDSVNAFLDVAGDGRATVAELVHLHEAASICVRRIESRDTDIAAQLRLGNGLVEVRFAVFALFREVVLERGYEAVDIPISR
jgi:hypothetical protein